MKRIEKIRERDGARERLLTLLMSLNMEKIEKILAVVGGILRVKLFIEETASHSIEDQEQNNSMMN